MKINIVTKLLTISIICAAIMMCGCVETDSSTTKTATVSYQTQEEYQVQIPYQVRVPYQASVTKTVDHKDPVYETLYSFTLIDGSVAGDEVYRRTNVYKYVSVHTGSDFWGNAEYMWTLYYYESIPNGVKRTATFQEIDEYSSSSFNGIVNYNEWSEDVITYETKYKTETKYRTETRYRTVTKYKTVEI